MNEVIMILATVAAGIMAGALAGHYEKDINRLYGKSLHKLRKMRG